MDYLWSPWRFRYLESAGKTLPSCVFCIGEDTRSDRERLIVHRATHSFVILNLYPYTSGHFMVAPYAHIDRLSLASAEVLAEIMTLAQRGVAALQSLYRPDGFNIGMNLGVAAGAGIKEHIHLHVVPRWTGDANFMTVTGETRVLPEELGVTYQRLQEAF
ncbi:MAG TPA: HIT domain-containing protein [Terriglobia bacterium]|nr:HIT domain-containing protein [Terriglobia bacterium]